MRTRLARSAAAIVLAVGTTATGAITTSPSAYAMTDGGGRSQTEAERAWAKYQKQQLSYNQVFKALTDILGSIAEANRFVKANARG